MSARPKSVKAIFLITMFKIALSWTFFAVFQFKGIDPAKAQLVMYTALAYMALAVPTFIFIHQRNATGVRICISLAILSSIPARAAIGIVIDVIALGLSFGMPAKSFFAAARA